MDIQPLQILFQMINFGVVAGVLTYFMYKPVQQMLKDRSDKVEAAAKAADAALLEKKNIDETRAEVLAKAEKDAQAIVKEAKDDAKRVEAEILAKANKAAESKIDEDRKRLASDYKETIKELRASFVTQLAAMTEKVIGEVVKEETIAKKLDEDIKAVIAKI